MKYAWSQIACVPKSDGKIELEACSLGGIGKEHYLGFPDFGV